MCVHQTDSTPVASAAFSNDPTALRILEHAAGDLATLVANTLDHLDFRGAKVPVTPIGGVFGSGELVQTPMIRRVHEAHPNALLQAPRLPPAQGAIVLALKELDIPVDDAVLANLSRATALSFTTATQSTEGDHV